jgi:hypothetical protein
MKMVAGRPWYSDEDMENMSEEALIGACWPRESNGRAIDIDRVVTKHLRIEPVLVALPDGVLGQTKFSLDGPASIEISRTLADEAAESIQGSLHRYRTTLAHEAAHVLFHSCLFIDQGPSLFDVGPAKAVSLCRSESVARFNSKVDWREFQANQGMACLLMPKVEIVKELRNMANVPRDTVVGHLSKMFMVSIEAARYRLEKLSPVTSNGQVPLL